MKISWTPKAIISLNEIFDYILADNPDMAVKVQERIIETINLLKDTPFLGTQYEMNIRKLPVGNLPYSIYYRIKDNQIEILQIRHEMRNPPETLQ